MMTSQDFNNLSEEEKLDICREAMFMKTIGQLGQKIHLYSLADGQMCKMHVRDPEDEVISISLCDEEDLKQFNINS